MTNPRHNIREIRAPRGDKLNARTWTTEAPLRMLMNNLDPDVAENPNELVVYGGIGRAARTWNDFDRLTPETRFIHNTRRRTQPWKTGLRVDFRPAENGQSINLSNLLHRARRAMFGEYGLLGHYKRHPDSNQERLFFALLKECYEKGIVTSEMLGEQMRLNYVRHDALEVMARTPTLAEQPLFAT